MDKTLDKKISENNQAGRKCANNEFKWHRIDGCCKDCRVHVLTNAEIQTRRNAIGYN